MRKVASSLRRLKSDTSGNVLYITAGLIFPMIALIGSGIDLGKAYMAKGRLQQACDAGVLAGRRAMTDKTFSSAAETAANNMFNANYAQNLYESRNLTFTPGLKPNSTTEVTANASASVPTSLMYVFGKDVIDISVRCTAKLEAANADIMFVLDTTDSMTLPTSDGKTRIQALSDEVMRFFDTVSRDQSDTSTIRYGIMPYSGNVNVGQDLLAANPAWIADTTTMPTRVFVGRRHAATPHAPYTWYDFETFAPNPGSVISTPTTNNAPTPELCRASNTEGGGQGRFEYISANGPDTTNEWTFDDYQGNKYKISDVFHDSNANLYYFQWDGAAGTCRQYRATGTVKWRARTETNIYTVDLTYTYKDVTFNVAPVKTGGLISANASWDGGPLWAGTDYCIMERDTVQLNPSATTAPAGAYDLNIDMIPTNNATRWHLLVPGLAFTRTAALVNSPNPQERVDTPEGVPPYSDVNARVLTNFTPCPSRAMRLKRLGKDDRSILLAQVNALKPQGFTYHDVGMIWGTRYISPSGIFAADNPRQVNGMPVDKHIIFMTDDEMDTNFASLGFQGAEGYAGRVGGATKAELDARHIQRFRIACNAAKDRGITVWVVAFGGTALTPALRDCASGSERAFQASNATELSNSFQTIAGSISRLRLSE